MSRSGKKRNGRGFLKLLILAAVILFLLSDASPLNLTLPDPIGAVIGYFHTLTGNSKETKEAEGRKKAEEDSGDSLSLPASYDLRDYGKAPEARSQGDLGTCWAFSRLSAIESTLLPAEKWIFSPDHMSSHSPGVISQYDAGSLNTADAYLLSWKGPVTEEEDPYGDGYSPDDLSAEKHVQEIQYLPEKDYNKIKQAVMKYGGVVTSLCIPSDNDEDSQYYNREKAAFCYSGTEEDNHDALIIGWDDGYSKSNFHDFAGQDGAFLVLSSWGNQFGDNGVFHVSYEDAYIGKQSEVYTGVENADNYDEIYQSDLRGETASFGFGRPFMRFANVYTAASDEYICAAGFYATEPDTSVKIYTVSNVKNTSPWFWHKKPAAQATFSEKGFYTVSFPEPVAVSSDERFAILAEITSGHSVRPIAIEYAGNHLEYKVDLRDGEGYLSCLGSRWYSAEKDYLCNLCLKAYTKKR